MDDQDNDDASFQTAFVRELPKLNYSGMLIKQEFQKIVMVLSSYIHCTHIMRNVFSLILFQKSSCLFIIFIINL